MFRPATRPCLLAMSPSGMFTQRPLTRWKDSAAVAHGIDPLPGGLLREVDLDRPRLPQRQPHLFRKRDVGTDPDRHQDHVGLVFAVVRDQAQAVFLSRLHGLRLDFRNEFDLVLPELFQDNLREFRVPAVHGKRPAVEDLRFDAEIPQRLGHLHSDEARPDDDRLPAGNIAEPGLDPDRVRELLQREDPFQRLSRYSRQERRRSRPQDEDIVGQGLSRRPERTFPAFGSISSTRVSIRTSIPVSRNFSGVRAISFFSSLITSPM